MTLLQSKNFDYRLLSALKEAENGTIMTYFKIFTVAF